MAGRRMMGGRRFAVAMGWRLLLAAGLLIGFPFLVAFVVVPISGCDSVPGACGAVALISGVFVKPAIVIVFLLLILWPPVRRMRSLGRPALAGLLVGLLLAADWQFLVAFGTHWSVAFTLGLVTFLPAFGLLALAYLLLLVVAAPETGAKPGVRKHLWSAALWLVAVVAALGVGAVALNLLWSFAGSLEAMRERGWMLATSLGIRRAAPYLAAAAAVPVALLILVELSARWRGRRGSAAA